MAEEEYKEQITEYCEQGDTHSLVALFIEPSPQDKITLTLKTILAHGAKQQNFSIFQSVFESLNKEQKINFFNSSFDRVNSSVFHEICSPYYNGIQEFIINEYFNLFSNKEFMQRKNSFHQNAMDTTITGGTTRFMSLLLNKGVEIYSGAIMPKNAHVHDLFSDFFIQFAEKIESTEDAMIFINQILPQLLKEINYFIMLKFCDANNTFLSKALQEKILLEKSINISKTENTDDSSEKQGKKTKGFF